MGRRRQEDDGNVDEQQHGSGAGSRQCGCSSRGQHCHVYNYHLGSLFLHIFNHLRELQRFYPDDVIGRHGSDGQLAKFQLAISQRGDVANAGGTALTGYQLNVVLGSGFDFTKTQSNGGDIRFTASDGVTLLPYWIESWDAGSSSASLWVKVPSIPAAGATVYLYYGNSSATSAANGFNTFDFFDDFSSGSIDITNGL